MQRYLQPLSLAFLAWLLPLASADGFIVIHDPMPVPDHRRVPPTWPGRPVPIPPVRQHTFAPLEVVYHQVDVRIRNQVSVTSVDQEFYNPNDRQLEGTYLFPVPKGAQIDRFSMEIGGKMVEAELLSADKARQIYEDIVRRQKDPALLEYAGRDAFKVRVFPIEPHAKKRIKLSYTQVLSADSGLVRYVYPLNTEKFSARPLKTVSVKVDLETQHELKTVYSPSHPVEIRRGGDRHATIGYEDNNVRPDTDFELLFSQQPSPFDAHVLTHHREGDDEDYFLLFLSPGREAKAAEIIAKDVVFVVDTSGSMSGKKLEQAKRALTFCLDNLNDIDRFEIVRFSTETEPLFGKLVRADKSARQRAIAFVEGLRPIGGTAIDHALRQAVALRSGDDARPGVIVFLTDGQPTVGMTDVDRIVANVQKQSSGGAGPRIFCFGIGNDVNTHLLDRITETTRAFSQYVRPDEDIEVKVSSFFAKLRDPVLTNLRLEFPDGVRVSKTYPAELPDLFAGEQLIVAGRYRGQAKGDLVLEGSANGAVRRHRFAVEFAHGRAEDHFIPRLWATRRVGFLLDEIRLRGEAQELKDEVAELARQFGIVTPYTSYLILEDEAQRGVPLAQQSLPALSQDSLARRQAEGLYQEMRREKSGEAAVSSAVSTRSFRMAENAPMAISRDQASLGLRYGTTPPASAARPASSLSGAKPDAERLVNYTQQTRHVSGRTFVQNGHQWVDTQVQRANSKPSQKIAFDSPEYYALVTREPRILPWLALGQNVVLVVDGQVYEITEAGN